MAIYLLSFEKFINLSDGDMGQGLRKTGFRESLVFNSFDVYDLTTHSHTCDHMWLYVFY